MLLISVEEVKPFQNLRGNVPHQQDAFLICS